MERRLCAIMVADMVGYSSLMEADEVRTLERQRDLRRDLIDPSIDRLSGRIVKELGDGLLVEFASVVDAVTCAVEIQRRIDERQAGADPEARIRYRIGINLGDVIVEGDDIFGDGVNVAARLEQLADPGGICVSGTAYDHLKPITDVGYQPLGETQVKNIERPVRVYRVLTDGTERAAPRKRRRSRLVSLGTGVAALVAIAVAIWTFIDRREPLIAREGGRIALAVMPFQNLGGDAEQDYFVDGMTDDLITDLSKISSLFVIARASVFAYKGRDADPETVAEELGVRYLLDGSVRSAGGQIRINSRLVDARTGEQVWADRFDGEMQNVFSLQDAVTRKIVKALQVELTPDEANRIVDEERETSPEVYDLYLRGIHALRQYNEESIPRARSFFLAALARDPDYAPAHAAMAFSFTASGIFYVEDEPEDALAQAMVYATRAVELDPNLPQAHLGLAGAYLRLAQHENAVAAMRRAIELDPNYADGYATLGTILDYYGKGDQALAAVTKAMELNPRFSGIYFDVRGRAYFALGDYEKAIADLEACTQRDHVFLQCHVYLTASYALAGRLEDAAWQAEEVRALSPDFRIGTNRFSPQFGSEPLRRRFEEALAAAGLAG